MTTLYDIDVTTIDGQTIKMNEFAGRTLLVVNVASKCGLTPQYEQLEALYEQYKDSGFAVLGFPSNEFGAQEPGSNEEIQAFCSSTYGVQFPMFDKICVNGAERHPLYQAMIEAQPRRVSLENSELTKKLLEYGLLEGRGESDIMWNFEKFLVNNKGEVVARFAPDITVESEPLKSSLEPLLTA